MNLNDRLNSIRSGQDTDVVAPERASAPAIPPTAGTGTDGTATDTSAEAMFHPPAVQYVRPAPAVDPLAPVKERAAQELFARIGARLNDSTLTEDQLHQIARGELADIVAGEQLALSTSERNRLIDDIGADVLGYGPLEPLLDDPSVSEIMVNRFDQLYVERNGRLMETSHRFTGEPQLRRVIERIVARVGRRIDESSPLVDARLEDGSRVNAIIPPLAVNGSSLTIRKFAGTPYTSEDLIQFGTLTREVATVLDAAVRAKMNILVSGGTGTGKTTLLNVLSASSPGTSGSSRSRMPSNCSCSRITSFGWSHAPRTSKDVEKSRSESSSATRSECAPTESSSARSVAQRAWTCCRP